MLYLPAGSIKHASTPFSSSPVFDLVQENFLTNLYALTAYQWCIKCDLNGVPTKRVIYTYFSSILLVYDEGSALQSSHTCLNIGNHSVVENSAENLRLNLLTMGKERQNSSPHAVAASEPHQDLVRRSVDFH